MRLQGLSAQRASRFGLGSQGWFSQLTQCWGAWASAGSATAGTLPRRTAVSPNEGQCPAQHPQAHSEAIRPAIKCQSARHLTRITLHDAAAIFVPPLFTVSKPSLVSECMKT